MKTWLLFFTAKRWCMHLVVALFISLLRLSVVPAASADDSFAKWVHDFWPDVESAGITRQTYDYAFSDIMSNPAVIKLAQKQPEFTIFMSVYLDHMLSERRVKTGLAKAEEYNRKLDLIEALYGVDRHVILAIWGMESSYGVNMGDKYVVRSLATLTHSGIRAKFFRQQLIAALRILQNGDMTREQLIGSWAGAMGQTQFIPTTFEDFAVDMDADGKRNLRDSVMDALASTANYLNKSGWYVNQTWGYPVILLPGYDHAFFDERMRHPSKWEKLGVRHLDGSSLSSGMGDSMLIFPIGARGPAFLVNQNFKAILRYNNSQYYALAVGLLSDQLRSGKREYLNWQAEEKPLMRRELKELQMYLKQKGERVGEIDGLIGPTTRDAIRSYQRKVGLPMDGYPSLHLLQSLR